MRGLLVFVASGLGLGAFWRRRRRRRSGEELPYDLVPDGPDPADELRAKLAENKAAADEEPAGSEDEEPAPLESSPLDPASRRRDLHERARASIDELR